MSKAMRPKRQMPDAWMTSSFPGTAKVLPPMTNSRSGRVLTRPQSMVYWPRRLDVAPTELAMAWMAALGPVMSEVPESTTPLVAPEEKEPALMSSTSTSQYLGSEMGIHEMSPVNLSSSEAPKEVGIYRSVNDYRKKHMFA